jgi:hypothetical protein
MNNYFEISLLAILLVLIYKKPIFLQNIEKNRINILILLFLNAYITKIKGIVSGIIFALITVILLDSKEYFSNNEKDKKEDLEPKIYVKTWRPAHFTSPCQTENDRILKRQSEIASITATHQ